MDIRMVLKRENAYLTADYKWSLDMTEARCYCSSVAFYDAAMYGATVLLRFANGDEQEVSFNQMFVAETSGTIQ